MRKELSLGKAILRCYQKGRFMTMMLSQNESTLPWIYYNNMQICCHKLNEKGQTFVLDICNSVAPFVTKEWDACPYIRDNSYSIERIREKYSSISQYIVECIVHNEYVHCCLNVSYITWYDKKRYPPNSMHDIFIFGYDDEKEEFMGYDYFSDDYERKSIPFCEMENAILHIVECEGTGDYANGIHSFLLQEPYVFFLFSADDLNINHILQKMYEILYIQYSEVNNMVSKSKEGTEINIFGLAVYDELCDYLSSNIEVDGRFDYRPFSVIQDHMQIICDAIKYFGIPFIGESENLLQLAIEMAHVGIKESIKHKRENIIYLCQRVIELKDEENALLMNVLKYYQYSI